MNPRLVLSDKAGNVTVHPRLEMLALSGFDLCRPRPHELISLPKGSPLFYMPGHVALGWDGHGRCVRGVARVDRKEVFAVAAFVVAGFTRLYLPAAQKQDRKLILPLWPYTAVGWQKGKFVVCATQIDRRRRQWPCYYQDRALLERCVRRTAKKFPKNRLFSQLAHCALEYNCRCAQNLFYNRWEAPVPVAPSCNARCLGCLSSQESDCAVASHERIRFVPSPQEILEVALGHLKTAREAMVSFGQGCEGEPLLEFATLKESIRLIRRHTRRGTIHLNTNGFRGAYMRELASVGLDSVRISINSFRKERYHAYYRPRGYGFADVLASVAAAKKAGLFVSLNLLVFPGLTDSKEEVEGLLRFLKKGHVDFLLLRNMSIDADTLREKMAFSSGRAMGILNMINLLRRRYPKIRLGYFNLPRQQF